MNTDVRCAGFQQLKLALPQRAGTIRRSLISAVVLAAACLGVTETARTYGAFALDPASPAWGVSWSHRSKSAADRAALSKCGTGCRVVLFIWNGCAGWAIDPTSGSTVSGWATRATPHAAGVEAVPQCQQCGGRSCQLRLFGCDNPRSAAGQNGQTVESLRGGAGVTPQETPSSGEQTPEPYVQQVLEFALKAFFKNVHN
jgi:hypothetical protein